MGTTEFLAEPVIVLEILPTNYLLVIIQPIIFLSWLIYSSSISDLVGSY